MAARTTRKVGARAMPSAAAAMPASATTTIARLARTLSTSAPSGVCTAMPASPLTVSTMPIEAWSQCSEVRRKMER